MIWLVGSLFYGAAALVAGRLVAGHFAYSMAANAERKWSAACRGNTGHPNGEQWFGAVVIAAVLATVWPLVLVAWRMPTGSIAIGAEARALKERQAARIAELERELNLR
jgi:hypothetical protein